MDEIISEMRFSNLSLERREILVNLEQASYRECLRDRLSKAICSLSRLKLGIINFKIEKNINKILCISNK